MSSIRQNKVARLLQKEISGIFHLNAANWFPKTMVTVTVVRVAPDLSFAKIYLSVFGDYTAAIILLVLNYVQIMCFLVFAIVLLVKLLKNYLI